MFEAEYLVRKMSPGVYKVSKWVHGSKPYDVYTVISGKCDCPSRRKCKHLEMVEKYDDSLVKDVKQEILNFMEEISPTV